MATQVMGQSPGGGGLFTSSGNMGMALPNDMYDLQELSKAELAAPQLIMLANVALTGEVNGGCCDYLVGEDRQMAELMPVGDHFSDSDGEGLEEASEAKGESSALQSMELRSLELGAVEPQQPVFEAAATPAVYGSNKEVPAEAPGAEDKGKSSKTKPFRCKPCQYEAESEEQFVHHIRVHSAKKFFVEESAEKQAKAREAGSAPAEDGDLSKGPIRCDRCGYNTNRYDHYTAHLKHHTRAGANERVYKCIICTYTTVSEYHWRKHLRNHFPRKVYTCGKCNYFSDRKNNYVQHVRTHTGERPYKCELCPYSSSQKTHLTRHMRTHSGEKPFKCDQCSYVASNQHEVTRHARQVHNGPKPLNCPHCDYKTADRSNFKKHVELHVNPRQFNCPVCDYAASKKCNLQYHFKSKHPTCPNKTMDVSKVKLKKTKKREADLPDASITNEKAETQPTKTKGDTAGKKNEKSVKVEKKDSASKEKKPCGSVSAIQVSTRTRKLVAEAKEADGHAGSSPEKSSKTKKSKRKVGADADSPQEAPNEEEPVAKKRKKAEGKCRISQEAPKGDSKAEEAEKQTPSVKKSTKKKTLKNRPSKRNGKLAAREPALEEPAPEEPDPEAPAPLAAAGVRLPSPVGPPLVGPVPVQPVPVEPLSEPVPVEPPPPTEHPLPMDPLPRKSPLRRESRKEKYDPQDERTLKEQVLSEVGLVPVKDSQPPKAGAAPQEPAPPSPPLPKEDSLAEEAPGPRAGAEGEGSPEMPVEEEAAAEAGPHGARVAAGASSAASRPSSEQSPGTADGHTPPGQQQADAAPRETEMLTDENMAEGPRAGQDPPVEGPASPLLPTAQTEQEAASSSAPASPPATLAGNESPEIEEDEGIHSHDGSDLSDNMSEGSDDSGLHGARPAPRETRGKDAQEALAPKAAQGDFVCIFCDRSFRKEKDYSKHLNRHLVNVYFLEKAATGQE
ncbi:RE1-silencing transcription factor [Ochotona princeps]|uniref:RE1-silencing transcription factor n=1 Tax=Ochotona princeps TaxID=9978 RepID=UPI0027150CB4|nr:RE1-silencing transcription factor [Ochotona princeps]